MSAIRAKELYKVFGRRPEDAVRRLREGESREDVASSGVTPAVIDANFEVPPGETFVVMGLSGSGKSTLIRMLNGLLEPTAGEVHCGDENVTTLDAAGLRRIRSQHMSMVFQHFALFPHRTVRENAAYALQVRGVDRRTRLAKADEALEMVGLAGWGSRLPAQLSGGMKQRVGLARALASETEVLLMDEAFSALDPLIRREMQDQLVELQHRLGKTIVFITHDLNEAMRLGDRIAMMRAGRIEQIGTAEEILNQPANEYVAQFVQDVDRTRVLTASAVMDTPRAVVSDTSGPQAALDAMREGQVNAAFVVGSDQQLLGVVGAEAAASALQRSGDSLREVLDSKATTVKSDTVLVDVFDASARSAMPVAVVDSRDRLVGAIVRETLLTAMAKLRAGEEAAGTTESGTQPDGDVSEVDHG
ncbi:glycine betaine/L-proline ABC transporter ATP-binding protein [Haloechinothrix sp. YIM 98757]|uniref:Glycine betaine/L-proline ABC transporter ATP-binding protein n=1 Tax=Haloechinothrix aidingensis TaxID=2752311 RepID=A0A838ABP8_9PSEU|nr:glycine betaine/L-proline ABC transporter ATP-binding protein [Haloechinothrix aidingensis]